MSKESERPARRRLGRGLDSLISMPVSIEVGAETPTPAPAPTPPGDPSETVLHIEVDRVGPNARQPRQRFDEEALAGLADSIRTAGLMQPIVVRPSGDRYELIAGERRWRAARLLGMERIPAVVRDADDETAAQWALIENVQREDLDAMERADAFRRLADEFGLTQEQIAGRVGLSRVSVTNHLRLLELEPEIQQAVRNGHLTMGHARALLAVTTLSARKRLADRCMADGWSVRELERRIRDRDREPGGRRPAGSEPLAPAEANRKDLEQRLGEKLGTRVRIRAGHRKGSGVLEIEFYDLDHFEGLLRTFGIRGD